VNHLRRLSLTLIATAALGAVGATAASAALPEFVGPSPLPFKSTLKASTLETVGGLKITCTGGSNTGELTGPKSLTVRITFTGCILNGLPCTSGAAAGAIETSTLNGTLGYIKKATKVVGIDLALPGAPLMAFDCGEDLRIAVFGSVIGRITPVDVNVAPPKHFTLAFAQKAGKQHLTHLEGGPKDVLETSVLGGPFEESGLAATDALSFAAPLLINA